MRKLFLLSNTVRISFAAVLFAGCADTSKADDDGDDDSADTSSANSDSDEPAAQGLAEAQGIPLAEAEKRIAWQANSDGLDADLAARPDIYGGIWIDPTTDRVQVGVVGNVATADIMALANSHGIGDGTDVVQVNHTLADLQSMFDDVDGKIDGTTLGATLDTVHNRVTIELPPTTLAPAEAAIVSELVARYGDAVVPVTSELVDGTLARNVDVYRPPARGGTYIFAPLAHKPGWIGQCTSGFYAHGNTSGSPYVLTAGHCFPDTTNWYTYFTPTDTTERHIGVRGTVKWDRTGDGGLIHFASPGTWKPAPWIVVHKNTAQFQVENSHYVIRSNGASSPNRYICHTGWRSGASQCGRITATVADVPFTDDDGVVKTQHNQTTTTMCTKPGDSGGPVYAAHQALGTISIAGGSGNNCFTSYQRIAVTEKQLGISVAHCRGTGASVEDSNDCCSLNAEHSRSNNFLTCQ